MVSIEQHEEVLNPAVNASISPSAGGCMQCRVCWLECNDDPSLCKVRIQALCCCHGSIAHPLSLSIPLSSLSQTFPVGGYPGQCSWTVSFIMAV